MNVHKAATYWKQFRRVPLLIAGTNGILKQQGDITSYESNA